MLSQTSAAAAAVVDVTARDLFVHMQKLICTPDDGSIWPESPNHHNLSSFIQSLVLLHLCSWTCKGSDSCASHHLSKMVAWIYFNSSLRVVLIRLQILDGHGLCTGSVTGMQGHAH